MKPILRVNQLKKTYHTKQGETPAIDEVSFSLEPGELIAIVGPSGCGKSTILSVLCNLLEKSGGTIETNQDTSFGYMLQQDCLFPWRTILDNCLLGLEITKQNTKENQEHVLKLLKTYGLEEFIHSYPANLSGGMRQRVALIRTLATKPDILLLDEPFSALDYQSRLAVSDDVYRIIKREKKSAIMVTHDLAEAISMADRIIVLTERPCQIKNIHSIHFEHRSTPIENRKCKEFSKYYDQIWKEIDFHV